MMIKILLVDDESWIRTSVKNKIDWTDQLILAGEASDGYEALNLAVNLRPDIVITDVRMPGMSGIEMLEKMRLFLPDVQSIFISGYNEFDYVKSAIELNASGYVLKPIRKEELNVTLKRTLEKIHQNNLLHKTTQTQIQLLHKFLEAFYNQLPVSYEAFSTVLDDLHFFKSHLYVLLVRLLETGEDSFAAEQQLTTTAAALSQSYTCTVFPVGKNVYGIFLTSREKINLLSYSRKMIQKLQQTVSLDVSIALGTPVHSVFHLPEAFTSARNSLKLMHLYVSHEIILPEENSNEELTVFLPKELQRRILDAIYSHNGMELNQSLNHLKDFILEQNTLTISEISRILHLLLGNILQILYDQEISRELFDKGISFMQTLSSYQPSSDILNEFCDYCLETALCTAQSVSITVTIQKAEQYLSDHYNEDISLKKMASLFYLNASYFSVSFKNITGKNFNEYLTDLRMENAKQYLKNCNLKVHQVARLVGYEDCSYFGKIFRKTQGMTPAEYQKNILM